MSISLPENWVNTKEVLSKTGISRATLNNYIRLGIIPKPLVQKPRAGAGKAKKIGYFPLEVMDRIRLVRVLKREGNSMEDIANQLKTLPIDGDQGEAGLRVNGRPEDSFLLREKASRVKGMALRLTLEHVRLPAYLLDYCLRVQWINQQAEKEIFGQSVNLLREGGARSIFELLFHWEFHKRVRNWRDMIAFHLSFAKIKYTKEWMRNLYQGGSESEVLILQEIYDEVEPFPQQTIKDTALNLLTENGTTKPYRVYTIFSMEGIFFLYSHRSPF